VPVVLVTALDGRADRIAGLEAGADEFLTKPIDDVMLFARVRSLTRLKAIIDELREREASGRRMGLIRSGATGEYHEAWYRLAHLFAAVRMIEAQQTEAGLLQRIKCQRLAMAGQVEPGLARRLQAARAQLGETAGAGLQHHGATFCGHLVEAFLQVPQRPGAGARGQVQLAAPSCGD